MTHKAYDLFIVLESSKTESLEVTKTVGSRRIHVDGHLTGWVSMGAWVWGNFARTRYETEELPAAKDSINGS